MRCAVVVSAALSVLALSVLPATAQTPTPPAATLASGGAGNHLVVLGDSWAAGTAAGLVDPTTGSCRRSPLAPASRVAFALDEPRWVSRACAGPPSAGRADDQFGVLDANTRLVIATVGADAVGLGALARACSTLGTPATCDDAAGRSQLALSVLPRALDVALAAMHARAPAATVVLAGYPLLAEGTACPRGAADRPRAARLDAVVATLDTIIGEHGLEAGTRAIDVRPAFRDHGVCAADPWLTPMTGPDPLLAGAPSATGQARGYAAALESALQPA